MPFNGSGTYVPPGSPTFPPTPGSVISSTYFTTIINDLGSALSLTFLRDGSLPLGGNLNLGGNKVTALGAGAVGALSINFNDDATTGLFLNGVGNLNLVTGGTTRIAASSAGVAITGTLSATGAITQAGNQVWHAGNFDKTLYATLAGPNTGGIVLGANQALKSAASPLIAGDGGVTTLLYLGSSGLLIRNNADSSSLLSLNNAGTLSIPGVFAASGNISSGGSITQGGNQVWHAGNFNPALYATLAGPNFTSSISIADGSAVGFGAGTTAIFGNSATGNIQIYTASNQRVVINSGGMAVTGALSVSAGAAITGTLSATGAITQNGQQVWHAGNFNSALYAPIASPTFTGTASVPSGEIGTRDLPRTIFNAAFAFLTSHRGGFVLYTGAAAAATINTNATTALPIGTAIVVVNTGSGALTFTRAGGVSLNWNGADANRVLAVGGMATLLKVDTDTWFVSGTLLS